jgi:hypothetical protein
LNVIRAFVPQVDFSEDVKRQFYKDLEDIIKRVTNHKKIFIGGYFNDHVGITRGGNRTGRAGSGSGRVGLGQFDSVRLSSHGSGWISGFLMSGHFRFRVVSGRVGYQVT